MRASLGQSLSGRAAPVAATAAVAAAALLWSAYQMSLRYFVECYSGAMDGSLAKSVFAAHKFIYLNRLALDNRLFFSIVALRFLTFFIRRRGVGFRGENELAIQSGFAKFCAICVVVILISPEKYPFFLASFLAPLAIFAGMLIEDVWAMRRRLFGISRGKASRVGLACALLFILSSLSLSGWNRYRLCLRSDNDLEEMALIRYLDAYLASYPKAQFYDVIGIAPLRATLRFFAGPNDNEMNSNAKATLLRRQPDLIFYANKLAILEPEAGRLLKRQYFSLGQGAYARWTDFPRPVPIDSSAARTLGPILDGMRLSSGATGQQRFHFEIQENQEAPKASVESSLEGLIRAHPGALALRASPFLEFEAPPPYQISSVFRFDGEF